MPRGRKTSSRLNVQKCRLGLIRLIDRACIARGEAQWTSGYRAGRRIDDSDDMRLFETETKQFHYCEVAERSAHRAIAKLIRAVRAEKS